MQDIGTTSIQTAPTLDPFALVAHSGPVSIAVLVILFIFSLVSWAIIFSKWTSLRRAESHSDAFLEIFRRSKKFSEVHAVCHQLRMSPLVGLFLSGYNELNYQLKPKGGREQREPRIQNLESVARSLVRATNAEVIKLERRLTFLATTGSSTPFIGLFGTVWGIMNAFQRIGAVQSANISVVAPGVSEALIATAAGLAAAIPAVIFYNYYLTWVKRLSIQMDDFALEYLSVIERNFT
ncbi:MAG TPA: MotA/TolQ/ExbB proton channel family protein [Vicinamibacteria bacterium]|nr:MotA/TolQ/ExbB proton channel family protein [Vicinamibacteria bacterium]